MPEPYCTEKLDAELNSAYQSLASELREDEREELRQSQRAWLAYKNAEFSFIEQNLTRENFGSSSVMSRGAYRTQIVKSRVIALLYYLKNY